MDVPARALRPIITPGHHHVCWLATSRRPALATHLRTLLDPVEPARTLSSPQPPHENRTSVEQWPELASRSDEMSSCNGRPTITGAILPEREAWSERQPAARKRQRTEPGEATCRGERAESPPTARRCGSNPPQPHLLEAQIPLSRWRRGKASILPAPAPAQPSCGFASYAQGKSQI